MDRQRIANAIFVEAPIRTTPDQLEAMTDAVLKAIAAHKPTKEEVQAAFLAFWDMRRRVPGNEEENRWMREAVTAAYETRFGKGE